MLISPKHTLIPMNKLMSTRNKVLYSLEVVKKLVKKIPFVKKLREENKIIRINTSFSNRTKKSIFDIFSGSI